MKIVVTASGETTESPVDPRFGRAAHFILVDTDSGETRAYDNSQNLSSPQGAGIQAASTVSRLGAECLITGHCGPKAYRTLSAAGIEIYTGAEGSVAEALEQYHAGSLQRAEGADVEGHWL